MKLFKLLKQGLMDSQEIPFWLFWGYGMTCAAGGFLWACYIASKG